MKKKGHTVIEMIISIGMLLLIMGIIGQMLRTHSDSYREGLKVNEVGDRVQNYFVEFINDITPPEEESDDKSVTIEKEVKNGVTSINILRSWEGKSGKFVSYKIEDGIVSRAEANDNSNLDYKSVIKDSRDVELLDIDIKVKSIPVTGSIKGIGAYTELSGISDGITLDNSTPGSSYYIEPRLKVRVSGDESEIFRGYGLRYSNVEAVGEGIFTQLLEMMTMNYKGSKKIKFEDGGYLKSVKTVEVAGDFEKNHSESCVLEDLTKKPCEEAIVSESLSIPSKSDISSLTDLRKIEASKKITTGIYQVEKIDISGKGETITISGDVKLYVEDDILVKDGASIVMENSLSKLLIVQIGDDSYKVEGDKNNKNKQSKVEGYIVANKVEIDGGNHFGAIISDEEAIIKNDFYIAPLGMTFRPEEVGIQREHIEEVEKTWW